MIAILNYHDVTKSKEDYVHAVPQSSFVNQIDYLGNHFTIVSLNKVLKIFKNKEKLPAKNLAVITFDDALRKASQNAFPFLIDKEIPFTVFVPTGLVGSKIQTKQESRRVMTLQELKNIAGLDTVQIESHGKTHTDFPELSEKELITELRESKEYLIRNNLSSKPVALAYPHGKSNFKIRKITSRYYEVALGGGGAIDCLPKINLMKLPRITVTQDMSFCKFKASLSTIYWHLKDFLNFGN